MRFATRRKNDVEGNAFNLSGTVEFSEQTTENNKERRICMPMELYNPKDKLFPSCKSRRRRARLGHGQQSLLSPALRR